MRGRDSRRRRAGRPATQGGAAAGEYAILLAAIAGTIIAVAFVIGPRMANVFQTVADAIPGGGP